MKKQRGREDALARRFETCIYCTGTCRENHEWDTLETEIREEFDRLEKANNDLGNKHDEAIESLRKQADEAITRKDVQYGRIVLKRIHEQFLQ